MRQQALRFPGFDGLRLLAAASVIFSHAFIIAESSEQPTDYLLWGPHNIVGIYGVFTFFIISGFLLTQSLSINPRLIQFTANRILRILPGFLFCIFITTFVFGAFFSGKSLVTYFTSGSTYHYFVHSIACLCSLSWKPPFFFTYSPFPSELNASLWSLSFEVLSYLFLIWLWLVFGNRLFVAGAFACSTAVTLFYPPLLDAFKYTLPFFAGGVVVSVAVTKFGTNGWLALTSLLVLCLSNLSGMHQLAYATFGAYFIVFVGTRYKLLSAFTERFGDWSYGLYLFGWPVEQSIKQLTRVDSGLQLFLYSLPLALVLAATSWFLVEKPCLALKKNFQSLVFGQRGSPEARGWPDANTLISLLVQKMQVGSASESSELYNQ